MNGFLSNVTEELKVRFLCSDATRSVMLEIMPFCTDFCQIRAEGSFSLQGRHPFNYVRNNNDFLYGFLPNQS